MPPLLLLPNIRLPQNQNSTVASNPIVLPNGLSGQSAQTPLSMNLPTNLMKDIEEMEEVKAGEVDNDAGFKHQKLQQWAEKVTVAVLDLKSEKYLKVPAMPMLAGCPWVADRKKTIML